MRGGHPNFEEASRGVTGQNRPWSKFGPTGVRVRVENCPVCPPPITECAKLVHKEPNRLQGWEDK